MNVRLHEHSCTVENPHLVSATVAIPDVAKGFLAYQADPQELRGWAVVVESLDVDLDPESHPAGEVVLGALWDASFGNPISPDVMQTIEQLAHQNGGGA
jgi:hypothetical protein